MLLVAVMYLTHHTLLHELLQIYVIDVRQKMACHALSIVTVYCGAYELIFHSSTMARSSMLTAFLARLVTMCPARASHGHGLQRHQA